MTRRKWSVRRHLTRSRSRQRSCAATTKTAPSRKFMAVKPPQRPSGVDDGLGWVVRIVENGYLIAHPVAPDHATLRVVDHLVCRRRKAYLGMRPARVETDDGPRNGDRVRHEAPGSRPPTRPRLP